MHYAWCSADMSGGDDARFERTGRRGFLGIPSRASDSRLGLAARELDNGERVETLAKLGRSAATVRQGREYRTRFPK